MQNQAQIDQVLRQKSDDKEIPGVVAMAANGKEVIYQGAYGKRDLSKVDELLMRARFNDKLDSFFVKPDDVADSAVMLTRQRQSAWTFELEARQFGEPW